MHDILKKYADLLVHYCVEIKEGDTLYITSTTLAEPLLRELYRSAVDAGALVEMNLAIREQERILLNYGKESQLKRVSPFHKMAMEQFDTFINIRAPFNLRETQNVNEENSRIRQEANQPVMKTYFERTATRDLRRSLCQFPTLANAQEAGMSLEEYQDFIFRACKLYDANPVKSWKEVGRFQQHIVDHLNARSQFTYRNEHFEISFSTVGRTWINSDGKTNMPSGEVYTSPVEDSVNGTIFFSYPGIYMGKEVEEVRLYVRDGYIEKWEARRGKEFLDHIFSLKGARRFGEAAIGTNTSIDRITKNILFDEKMGGSVHMAIGQSYLQAGGKNESSVHWDMITDMRQGGQILADGELVYEDGGFLI